MKTMNLAIAILTMISGNALFAQELKVNPDKSNVEWIGKKIGSQHNGNIKRKNGSFEIQGDKITAGNFVMDMTSITNSDVKDEGYNKKIVGHLKSDDFFGVEEFPTASLIVTESSKFSNGKATVTGDITIKGKTENISFDVEKTGNEYTAKMDVDRSKFDVRYGSKSFFNNLGDKAIDDIFTLHVKLVAN